MLEEKIETIRTELLSSNGSLETLERVLETVKDNQKASEIFWESDELIFVILQNFTDSFYKLNTELFDEKEVSKARLCIDILTSIVQLIRAEEFFLKMQLDYYIYPFLMSSSDESLKISALRLFSALLINGVTESMRNSELLPLLLKIIDSNSENCQKIALETLELILNGTGLDYAVQTLDRFQAIDVVLSSLMKKAVLTKNVVFLKLLIRIYIRLCDKSNVRIKVKEKMPEGLDSKEIMQICEKDNELLQMRLKFLHLLS